MLTKVEIKKSIDDLISKEIEIMSPLLSRLNDGRDSFRENYPSNIIEALHERTRLPKGLLGDTVYILYRITPPETDRTDSPDSELYRKALRVCRTRAPLVLLSSFYEQLERETANPHTCHIPTS